MIPFNEVLFLKSTFKVSYHLILIRNCLILRESHLSQEFVPFYIFKISFQLLPIEYLGKKFHQSIHLFVSHLTCAIEFIKMWSFICVEFGENLAVQFAMPEINTQYFNLVAHDHD